MTKSASIVRFCLVLAILPAAVTFLFLSRQIQLANICFVEDDLTGGQQNNNDNLIGIYRQRSEGFSSFSREAPFAKSWSSIAEMGRVLAPPVRSDKDMLWALLAAIADITGSENSPELTYRSGHWCVEPGKMCFSEKGKRLRPSQGVYSNRHRTLKVTCHEVKSIFVDREKKKRKRDRTEKLSSSKEIEEDLDGRNFVAYRPASALLVAVMVFLAYHYSNQEDPTEHVAISYNSIVERWEFWRAFTGTTAHLKPMHLASNMYSLYILGSELEESYGSIPFLMYNIALIPITVILTLILIKMRGDARRHRQLIVGFSGVLFAWSTVAATRLPISWPFPYGKIGKDFYFKTIKVGPVKFNASPFVRAGIIYLLVPSTSLESHLAGAVAGLAMQWGFLPLALVQPAVLIPLIMWLHFYAVRRVISSNPIEQVILENHNDSRAVQEHQRVRRGCEIFRNMLVLVGFLGCKLFEWSMTLQLAFVLLFLNACIVSYIEDIPGAREVDDWRERVSLKMKRSKRSVMLWQAFLLTCFLSVLSDAMAFGGWMSCNSFWFSDQHYTPLQFWSAGVCMLVRIGLQVAAFAVAAKIFLDLRPDSTGIFVQFFARHYLRDGATAGTALLETFFPILS